MKRKLLLLLLVLLVAGGGIVAYGAYNANTIIERHKGDLERVASDALDADVTLAGLSVSFFPSVELDVDELKIAPRGRQADGLRLGGLTIGADLFALLRGNLSVTRLTLEEPLVSLVKTPAGIEIEGLSKSPPPRAPREAPRAGKGGARAPGPDGGKAELPSWLSVNLKAFEVRKGTVIYKDSALPQPVRVESLSVDAALSLAENRVQLPQLLISATVPGNAELSIRGKEIRYHLVNQTFVVEGLDIQVPGGRIQGAFDGDASEPLLTGVLSTSGLSLRQIEPVLRELQIAPNVHNFEGKVGFSTDISVQPKGFFRARGPVTLEKVGLTSGGHKVSALSGTIQLEADQNRQTMTASEIKLLVGEQPINLSFKALNSAAKLVLEQLKLSGFGGSLDSSFELTHRDQKPFQVNMNGAGIDLQSLFQAIKPELTKLLEGTVDEFGLEVRGRLGTPDLKQSLVGTGQLRVSDAQLKQINLLAEVLGAVKDIPMVSGALAERVPEERRGLLEANFTTVKSLTSRFHLGDQQVGVKAYDLVSDVFRLSGKGLVSFTGALDLDSEIRIAAQFSEALVASTKELKYALDEEGQLVIPLLLRGVPPSIQVRPNLEALVKRASSQGLRDKASKALDKALGDGAGKTLENLLGF